MALIPAIAKAAQVGGDAVDADDAQRAFERLQRLADVQRRRSPDLSKEQAFSRVFTDPANAVLAAKALVQR